MVISIVHGLRQSCFLLYDEDLFAFAALRETIA